MQKGCGLMIPERDTYYPSFSLTLDCVDYIDTLYKNLRKRLRNGYNEKNFYWILGSEVVNKLFAYFGRSLESPLSSHPHENDFTLYGIRVEENRVNPNTIRIYEDITEFLEHD